MPLSAREIRVAESLLRFMRDPADLLESVSESIEIGSRELRREVTLRLRPGSFGRKQKWAYLDVLHPRKGGAAEIRVDSPDEVARIASHSDHLAVSTIAIQVRFLSVWRSAIVPAGHQAAFRVAMLSAFRDLARLPELSESKARDLVDLHFDYPSGILRAVRAAPGTVIDATRMNGLFELCKRLQNRYLVLLKVKAASAPSSVVFSYPNAVDEYDVRKPGTQNPRPLSRHLSHATPPGSFRLHVPWAKRTHHYELHVDAPEGYFFSRQVLLAGTAAKTKVIPDSSPAMWSINTGQGRHSTMFLGSASAERDSIHAGLQSLEIPGRSTSRAFMLGVFVTLVLAGFALLAWATAGPIMPTASLVVGLLAVGALVVTPPIGPGVLGFPLLSRFTPAFLAVVSVVFIFWLASLDAVPSFAIGHDPVGTVLRALWATWCLAGGWALVAAALVATVRMGARRHALFRNFRAATVRPNPRSSNFF